MRLELGYRGRSRTRSDKEASSSKGHPCKDSRYNEVKVKVNFTLEQATKVRKASRGIALLFL
jgi:hypothetical protein